MPKGNHFSKKEFNGLLWQYLKRSPDYEEFCKWAAKKEKESSTASLYPLSTLDTTDLPPKFRSAEKGKFHLFFHIYSNMLFGDLRFRTFQDFERQWNFFEEFSKHLPLVESYSQTLEGDFNDALVNHWNRDHKNHSLDELKRGLQHGNPEKTYAQEFSAKELKEELKEILKSTPGRIVLTLRIDRTQDIQNLQNEIDKFLTRELNDRLKNNWQKDGWWIYPPPESRIGENIRRYLNVYILRHEQGKDWEEIFNIIFPKLAKELSDNSRSYRQKEPLIMNKETKIHSFGDDIRRFERIIRNLSRGTFPGK